MQSKEGKNLLNNILTFDYWFFKLECILHKCSMAGLLSKFRIDYSDLILIPDVNKKPQDSTKAFFEEHIAGFRQELSEEDEKNGKFSSRTSPASTVVAIITYVHILFAFLGVTVSDAELLAMKDKTNRHMRLRELLQQHSRGSSLVVM